MSRNKIDKKGRSKGNTGTFTMLKHEITRSKAWFALTAPEKAVFIQILLRLDINKTNNGKIFVSQRTLADECHITRPTVAKSIKRLQEIGFIEIVSNGTFNCKTKLATEYRLTFEKCNVTGKLASNKWRDYEPEKVSSAILDL